MPNSSSTSCRTTTFWVKKSKRNSSTTHAVTREEFRNTGRLPVLIENGKLCADIGLPQINPTTDRAMICGGPAMLKDLRVVLDGLGFTISAGIGQAGDYVIERAFVEKCIGRILTALNSYLFYSCLGNKYAG